MASPFIYRFRHTLSQIVRHETKVIRHFCDHHGGKNTNVTYTSRTHLCGELRSQDVGKSVLLCGWLQFHRLSGAFMILRDWKGSVQLILPQEKIDNLRKLSLESVVQVKGQVKSRPPGQENKTLATGDIEIAVEDIQVLNACNPTLPIDVKNIEQVSEALRIKYRYIDLRLSNVQENLRTRSKLVMGVRGFLLNQNEFVEVETPTLFRRTPGGAREFVVPTHNSGKFYCLPQSPQQFKQLLMVGGIDRYFQVARCYRDEGSRHDRQPEFTQLDIEMSFVTKDDVMSLVEKMIQNVWPNDLQEVVTPFKRMTYQQAMSLYGSDKPDTRLNWQIKNVTEAVKQKTPSIFQNILITNEDASLQALRIPGAGSCLSKKQVEVIKKQLTSSSHSQVMLSSSKVKTRTEWSGVGRYLDEYGKQLIAKTIGPLEPSDIILFSCGTHFTPHTILGQARILFADAMEAKGVAVRNKDFSFLWVEDFPLFLSKDDGSDNLESAHHPFTAPHPDDTHTLYSNPSVTRGLHYDLVLNGAEIGGGSIRIHNSAMQRFVLENVLKEDSGELQHLLHALDSGCPPHGGIALGLDRLIAILCGADSIRDVIAFPKIQGGKDPLSDSPSSILPSELAYYHIHSPTDDGQTQNK